MYPVSAGKGNEGRVECAALRGRRRLKRVKTSQPKFPSLHFIELQCLYNNVNLISDIMA